MYSFRCVGLEGVLSVLNFPLLAYATGDDQGLRKGTYMCQPICS